MKKMLRILLLLFFLAVFCFAAYKLLGTFFSYRQASGFYDETVSSYVTFNAAEDDARSLPPEEVPQRIVTEDGRHTIYVQEDGKETAPIRIDFEALTETCADTVGWIYSEDTAINYPVVQAEDNDYYLHRMLDGSENSNGTIFMDYLCRADLTSGNTLLYGHNMKDGSMFHSLVEYKEQKYYNKHPVLYYLTPEQNYRVDLFAGVTVAADAWPYVVEFGAEAEKTEFLQRAKAESTFEAPVEPTAEDRILSLSTCTYEFDNARYIVMGILTPIE